MRIDANARTIKLLLTATKYQLDYYQREYSWQTQHVSELIDDLTSNFLDSYKEGHEQTQVPGYGHYFLGSIIISNDDGKKYIVDGQQRLTTLTLLLIRIYHLLKNAAEKDMVKPLIYSLAEGVDGFNLNVDDRKDIMDFLYPIDRRSEKSFDVSDKSESIRNIAARYSDIEENFEIQGKALSSFVFWLLENVYLVTISAFDSRDAYAIFETVNDRGLSLTPAEMLGGYLLSSIENIGHRDQASEVWRERIQTLKQLGKNEESEAIKAWLRSQYAQTTSDFDAIGSEFHRWVQEPKNDPKLEQPHDFANFIKRDFKFYSTWYRRLRRAANSFTAAVEDDLECVFYNAQHNKFAIQYPILLAPLRETDSDTENLEKVQIVASYLDILIYRRIWNLLSIARNTMDNLLPPVIPEIRGKSCNELRDILHAWIQENTPPFADNDTFGLHGGNRRKILLILARLTEYVGVQSGESRQYEDYMRTGSDPYEIEHIWANKFERHADEFPHESEFELYRNRIGGLLLLPKSVNASSGDDPYTDKRKVYAGQNLLAKTLTEQAYKNNPAFIRFKESRGLPFCKHPEFKKEDLDARQKVYLKLAEQIWNPERLRLPDGIEPEIVVEPENSHGNQRKSDEDNVQALEELPKEEDNVEVPDLGDENISVDTKKVSAIEPIKDEIREFYKTKPDITIRGFCKRISELLNLIEKKGWNELTFKLRKLYCAFYLGSNPLFGAFLFEDPRYVIWMDAEDVEKLRSFCEFRYIPSRRQAIYPEGTTIEEIQPALEYVYMKHGGNAS